MYENQKLYPTWLKIYYKKYIFLICWLKNSRKSSYISTHKNIGVSVLHKSSKPGVTLLNIALGVEFTPDSGVRLLRMGDNFVTPYLNGVRILSQGVGLLCFYRKGVNILLMWE